MYVYIPGMAMLSTNVLLAKYDRPVPRYTSFPTAVQFTDTISPEAHRELLRGLDRDEPISLYLHIPFCHSLCHYCGCHTKITATYEPVGAYIRTLLEEVRLCGDMIGSLLPAARIHFGGGSPNFAETEDLSALLSGVARSFLFSEDTQIDMECDPRLLTEEKIAAYAAMGVTRVSLGIQDFDENVQRAINRVQPYELVRWCVQTLRRHGIHQINFDLIVGLPEQTVESVSRTADLAMSLSPQRLAVFPYAHVPWMKKHQTLLEKFQLPGAQERFDMIETLRLMLTRRGYREIGIDHYALETDSLCRAMMRGYMRRNFQGYTDDPSRTILGFGLSSISQFETAYVQNTTDAPSYRAALSAQNLPIQRGCFLSADDRTRRALIERLMCDFRLSFADFPEISVPRDLLALLEQDGLLRVEGDYLQISEHGKPFVRVVAACFDPYLNPEAGRHARAV
ncbi:MAG: oxygen-independent coproporphyrinogen III oxidase [Alphaproteobacteria bacterium]|nr:oxygen-independent coproporphyrinogen III oxidase [Alphaproteobacteria bacterium]MBP7759567.1 oxygen-independent coproporphyrinogen III oxidase [Alphaproteobacteria bacterium]MBP7762964.1 oxygen-independent coproporphyrinogen III oxidase [Alphaproteobacteria bacterium]MBP7904227.1 oxygen-independent coproporphyrinogen III oxidase [Alphaproteobacteria bacterium]